MTLSVVIPTWSGTPALADMAYRLCQQVRPMCDELIITEDGEFSSDLKKIADIYLIHPRLGHAENLKFGIQHATKEFIALIDSDMEIVGGTLRDLCVPDRIVSPESVQGRFDDVAGWFLVCPRSWIVEFPPFGQPSQTTPEGIDIWTRELNNIHRNQLISSDKVRVHHSPNTSYDKFKRRFQEVANSPNTPDGKPRREIMPDRHRQRLVEDPVYAAEWADKD